MHSTFRYKNHSFAEGCESSIYTSGDLIIENQPTERWGDLFRLAPYCLQFGSLLASEITSEGISQIEVLSLEGSQSQVTNRLNLLTDGLVKNAIQSSGIPYLDKPYPLYPIEGIILASSHGTVFSHSLSAMHEGADSAEISRKAACLMDALRVELPDCCEVRVDMKSTSVYVRYFSHELVFIVIADRKSDFSKVRQASRLLIQELNNTADLRGGPPALQNVFIA